MSHHDDRHPARPSLFRRWWEPWRQFPELHRLPPPDGLRMYGRAWRRMWRHGRTWLALATVAALWAFVVAVLPILVPVPRAWTIAAGPMIGLLVGWPLSRMLEPTLARCVRIVLGTHCPRCDYDLRATPDPNGARVSRCPECGLSVSGKR